jgi:hypothetical protein
LRCRRKSTIKKNNFKRLKEKHVIFANDLVNKLEQQQQNLKEEQNAPEKNGNDTESILISTLSYPSSVSSTHSSSSSTAQLDPVVGSYDEQASPRQELSFEFDFNFRPLRSDFFLYTIHEHQLLTKKKFGYKKRIYNSLLSSSNLSKSDSNIVKSCDNKSFI